MYATAAGTARYTGRHAELRDAGFYRTIFNLEVSTLGIGTYLSVDTGALLAAAEGGINFFDTAINYGDQRAERAIGAVLAGNSNAMKSWFARKPAF